MKAKIDELLKRARRLDPNLCADRERYIAEISFKAGIREGVRRAYQFMKDQHYVVDYDLDHAVDFLEKKYGKPN